jgi:hypothetical protein
MAVDRAVPKTSEPDADLIRAAPFGESNGDMPHNASEVVAIGDARFLFCDNNISDALFEMRVNRQGQLAGRLIRHAISGVSPRFFDDFESMALVGQQPHEVLVLATSFSLKIGDPHARKKTRRGKRAIERESLLRLTRTGPRTFGAEIIPGFRRWLIDQTPDLGRRWRRGLERIPDDGGLNVEGLAWDPGASELHFGLRSPVIHKRPVILRVHVKNVAGLWNLNNFVMRPPVLLDLPDADGDRGIRTMEYDPRRQATLIVTGNAVSRRKVPFELWEWDGNPAGTVRKFEGVRFHRKFRVEGVTPGVIGGRPALVFVDDRGGYQVVWGDDARLA